MTAIAHAIEPTSQLSQHPMGLRVIVDMYVDDSNGGLDVCLP